MDRLLCRGNSDKADEKKQSVEQPSQDPAALKENVFETNPVVQREEANDGTRDESKENVFKASTVAPRGKHNDGTRDESKENVFEANTVVPCKEPNDGTCEVSKKNVLETNTVIPREEPNDGKCKVSKKNVLETNTVIPREPNDGKCEVSKKNAFEAKTVVPREKPNDGTREVSKKNAFEAKTVVPREKPNDGSREVSKKNAFEGNKVVAGAEANDGVCEASKENVAYGKSKSNLLGLLHPWGDGNEPDDAVIIFPSGLKDMFKVELSRQKSKGDLKSVPGGIRSDVVNWLIDVGIEYVLPDGAVFLAVYYLDAFLAAEGISIFGTRCIATAALSIASRLEGPKCGLKPLSPEDLVALHESDIFDSFVIGVERTVFWKLVQNGTVCFVTSRSFLICFLEELGYPEPVGTLAQYMLELALVEGGEILDFLPSVQAASALALAANTVIEDDAWKENFVKVTTHTLVHLLPCMIETKSIWANARMGENRSVYLKYSAERRSKVASFSVCPTLPQ